MQWVAVQAVDSKRYQLTAYLTGVAGALSECLQCRLAGILINTTLRHPIPQGFSSLLLKPYIKGVGGELWNL